jgi:two-component system chemotaxis sensor kinase CheA
MSALLEQFIVEGRDFLQGIGEKLMALENAPDSVELMTELFRLVHTLKGNSGLFDFPEMTRVLHAGEDLMDSVRDGRVAYSQELADHLLDAMDFVGLLIDKIESHDAIDAAHIERSTHLAQRLRALIPAAPVNSSDPASDPASGGESAPLPSALVPALDSIPEAARIAAWHAAASGKTLFWIEYRPDEECFFKGEDPFLQMRRTPGLLWGKALACAPWPALAEMDCFRCLTRFNLLVAAERSEIDEYFRYVPEQVALVAIAPLSLVVPLGHPNGGPVYGDFVAEALLLLDAGDAEGLQACVATLLELSAPGLWLSSALRWLLALFETHPERPDLQRLLIDSLDTLTPPDWSGLVSSQAAVPLAAAAQSSAAVCSASVPSTAVNPPPADDDRRRLEAILAAQSEILALPDQADWLAGRLQGVAATLTACLGTQDDAERQGKALQAALASALAAHSAAPLRAWLLDWRAGSEGALRGVAVSAGEPAPALVAEVASETKAESTGAVPSSVVDRRGGGAGAAPVDPKYGRRAEDAQVGRVLKVDQVKVDLLMNLIGEMVVAKNSLPYLANRAENQFGVRELAREIKAQYAVINRIAEEMQDAIMQVRMTPVSFVFQRFPRLVRDLSRKLGKEVELVLEGEETEADKNIVEALADPLVHIVRNSLDHGLEMPEERVAAGKPRAGKLLIRAVQEADRVLIEIIDDGHGIDPSIIKRKAYEKGIIDEATLERIGDQEAINLIFGAGFSTAASVSDLSGRGVGMDVVRSTIDRLGGAVTLASTVGKGTTLCLSLPLSMAVTNVMIVESDRQIFGVPMDSVVETVRLPRSDMRTIKRQKTTVLRGRIVPLMALNDLLGVAAQPLLNADDEFAALVVRIGGEQVGLLVDDFREVVDVILKPLPGELGKLAAYAGTALLGDGSVLMVLNPKELF